MSRVAHGVILFTENGLKWAQKTFAHVEPSAGLIVRDFSLLQINVIILHVCIDCIVINFIIIIIILIITVPFDVVVLFGMHFQHDYNNFARYVNCMQKISFFVRVQNRFGTVSPRLGLSSCRYFQRSHNLHIPI